jgi:hypothetical protein
MKKLSIVLSFMIAALGVFAQKYVPKFKAGSTIDYMVAYQGQDIPFGLTVKSTGDPLILQWDIDNYGSGTFEMTAKAVQSGTKMGLSQPAPGVANKLGDNETFSLISKAALESLSKTKAFEYGGTKYTDKTDAAVPFKINGKDADVYHVISTDGKHEMWILNNPDLPLVCKTKGNPSGIDVQLAAIKE